MTIHFNYLVPLISKELAPDWPVVISNLNATLESITNAGDPSVNIIIVCNERPEINPRFSQRVRLVSASTPIPKDLLNNEWHDKRQTGAAWIRKNLGGPCYLMWLDSDDWAHRSLSKWIKAEGIPSCYRLSAGYRYDMITGKLGYSNNFDRSCGSSFVGYFEEADLPESANEIQNRFSAINFSKHRQRGEKALKSGMIVQNLPFRAAAYITNHASSARRAKLVLRNESDDGLRELSMSSLIDNHEADRILLYDFGQKTPRH